MAFPPCQADDGNTAVFIGTFFDSGVTVTLCDEHLVAFLAYQLQAMTGVPAAPFLAAIEDDETDDTAPVGGGPVPDLTEGEVADTFTPDPKSSGRSRAKSPAHNGDSAAAADVTDAEAEA